MPNPYACTSLCPKSFTTLRSLQQHQQTCAHFTTEFQNAALGSHRSLKRPADTPIRPVPGSLKKFETSKKLSQTVPLSISLAEEAHDIPGDVPLSPLARASLSPPELLRISPPPVPPPLLLNKAGRPIRAAARPAPVHDFLPQAPPAVLEQAADSEPNTQLTRIRRVFLIVRDTLKTQLNPFRLYRLYPHRPTFDPDAFVSLDDLAKDPRTHSVPLPSMSQPPDAGPCYEPPWPFKNMSIWRLMRWSNTGSSLKSEGEVTRLVKEVIATDDFNVDDLRGFNAHRENQRADKTNLTSGSLNGYLAGFCTTSVDIQVPSGQKNVPSATFSVPGLHYRPLLSVIKEAFSSPLSMSMHLSPFKLFHQLPNSELETRVHGELYSSDSFINMHDKIQRTPLPPDESDCKLERVVAAVMLWSDATHLANFGTAKLWPIYLMLGNVSKYIRAQPDSGACHHLAYIPSLPDSFQDFAMNFHAKWKSQKSNILTHCRRELMHAIWKVLLTDEFIHAFKYGVVIRCADGVERRVYPRFFTYSADYPEKVLLATIRDKGCCPCPRCLVSKSKLDRMGQVRDIQTRLRHVWTCFIEKVKQARKLIYTDGRPINGVHVERLLKETSSVPTENAFVERLGTTDFDFSKLLVVDFLHEFELGVWKTLFKHLIRVLYACPNGADKVSELDARLRQVSTFGVSTIRRFANNASEMKKLAARDFEDLLQCAIPAFEGLLPNEHDVRLMKLLYRLGEWHALAKLRMHTDETLESLASCTPLVGTLMREFRDKSCSQFQTVELPSEQQARSRRQAQIAAQYPTDSASRKPQATERKIRTLNLFTYKFHAMADYIHAIPWFGTIDSYSTQLGELAHRLVKRLYGLTNKREHEGQIGRRYKRAQLLSKAQIAKERANLKGKGRAVEITTPSGVREEMAHAHQVGFGYGERPEDLIVPLQAHHFMSSRRDHPVDLTPFLQQEPLDPSKKDFLPKLEDHLLGRLRGIPFDGDYEFTDKERQSVVIMNERIYSVKTLRINYTTYDVRRDQDVINPSTDHCTVLLNSPETQHNAHRYWYAQVLGIFHADIIHLDTAMGSVKSKERMEFLWVRWLGIEPDYRFGSKAARLPKVGFIPENDDFAFGFLDPLHVIRACHLIPDFVRGKTNELLGTSLPTAARKAGESSDWWNYYVMIFVDRDMFMRYRGGGVGHIDLQSSEDYGVSPGSEDEDDSDKLVMVAGGRSNPDDEEQLDNEEFDSDDDSEAAEHNWLLDYLDPSHQYDSSDDSNESESSSE